MQSVCAWCGKLLGDTRASPRGTTHGICSQCDRQLRAADLFYTAPGDEAEAECPSLRDLIAELRAQPT
jgi:hypothetical protein